METFRLVEKIAASQDGVITARQCLDAGLTRGQIGTLCRKNLMRRLFWGAYLVNADLHSEPSSRARIRAAMLSAGRSSVAVRDTAAEVLGIAGARPGDKPVRLSHPPEESRHQRIVDLDIRFSQLTLDPSEVVEVDGLRTTSAVRTCSDLLCRLDRLSAVSTVDSALNRQLITVGDLVNMRDMISGRPRAPQVMGWLDDVDGRSESPLESRARVRCVDGGVPPDDLQVDILDDGGLFVARVDFLWRAARLIGEADGAEFHDRPGALFRDRERQNALIALGYKVVRFTWADTIRPGTIPEIIRTALGRPWRS